MVPFKHIINTHSAKLKFTILKTRAASTTTTNSTTTITPTTRITPKHIGTIVEMDSNYTLFLILKLVYFITTIKKVDKL